MRPNETKTKLRSGELALGTMALQFASAGIGAVATQAGADFVLFDMEHTGWSFETLAPAVASMRQTGAVPLVRIPVAERSYLSRALDIGALGVMVPMVGNGEQARDIVRWSKYPPEGVRGAAFAMAHDNYSAADFKETMASANDEVLVIAQVETREGLENVRQIAETEGIDVVWVGHFDLTNSLGIPGLFDSDAYRSALEAICTAARSAGKSAGFAPGSISEAQDLIAMGFRCLAYSRDSSLFASALESALTTLRTEPALTSNLQG